MLQLAERCLSAKQMPMELRRKSRAHIPWRIVLWSLVVLVFVLDFLNDTPLHVNTEFPAETPVALTREALSDVVVVIDYEAIQKSPPTFSQRDFSAAWINVFEQELGPVTIATPKTLSQKMIDEARVVVLTSSVSRSVPDTLIKMLRDRVLQNRLLLVMERPEGLLRERFSADGKVQSQRGEAITFARNIADPYRQQLLQMPINVDYVGSTAPLERATTWLSIDGAPVIYDVPIGEGRVVTIDFDFGELLVATQQGRPGDDFQIKRPKPHTWDLIADARLKQNSIPFADILERFVVHGVIGELMPLPFFWSFPGESTGALIAVHDDAVLGDGGSWMLRHETDKKAVSTLFTTMDSGITSDGAALVDKLGGDLGLLWRLQETPAEILHTFGVGPIKPFARPTVLEPQLETLRKLATGPVNTSQIYGHHWTKDWTTPLSALAASGVRVDVSYSQDHQSGYAFGTGLPFLALDSNGLPLSIRELPIVVPHDTRSGPEIGKLLEASSAGHHQAITFSHRPSAFADYPDLTRFNAWLQIFQLAEDHKHPIMSVNQFDQFQRSRRAGSLRTEFNSTDVEATLRLTAEAKRRDLQLVVPARIGSRNFVRAVPRGTRSEGFGSAEFKTEATTYTGISVIRMPLNAGFNTIDVVYQ